MSKHNKVNKGNYDQAGRLTPDEAAREEGKIVNAKRGTGGTRPERGQAGSSGVSSRDEPASPSRRSGRAE